MFSDIFDYDIHNQQLTSHVNHVDAYYTGRKNIVFFFNVFTQGALNETETALNLCGIFSISRFNEFYLFGQ